MTLDVCILPVWPHMFGSLSVQTVVCLEVRLIAATQKMENVGN